MEEPRFAGAPAMTTNALAQQDNGPTSLDPTSPAFTTNQLQSASVLPSLPVIASAEQAQTLPPLGPQHYSPPDTAHPNFTAEESVHMPSISENTKMRRRASARTNQSSAAQSPGPESPAPPTTDTVSEPKAKGAQQPSKAPKKRAAPSSTPAHDAKSPKRPRSGPIERGTTGGAEQSSPALNTESRRPRASNSGLPSEVSTSSNVLASKENQVPAEAMAPPSSKGKRRSARTSSMRAPPLSETDQALQTPPPTKDHPQPPIQPKIVTEHPHVASPLPPSAIPEPPRTVQEQVKVPAPYNEPKPAVRSFKFPTPDQSNLSPGPVTGSIVSQDNSLITDQDDEILLSLKLEKAQAHKKELQFHQEELDIRIHMRQVQLRKSRNNVRPLSGTAVASIGPKPPADALDAQIATLPETKGSQAPVSVAPQQSPNLSQGYIAQNNTLDIRPHQNAKEDFQFLANVKQHLKRYDGKKVSEPNFTHKASSRLLPLLESAAVPSTSEALWLTGREAAELVKPGAFFPGPIITEGQQILPLQSPETFLSEYYDDTLLVWIQDQAVKQTEGNHARLESVGAVKGRLNNPTTSKRPPWNCLELATHRDDGLRPYFLNNEECSLLTKIKQPGKNDEASRRGFIPGWREVEKWALLAQGGALTEPHQDSHGYSTFITVNHGRVGFGWLSNPSQEERTAWCKEPWSYSGGRWRYVVLRPGQTIYFPTGTAHFVFRLPADGHTLAFGGHILRCSQIVAWARTILEEQDQPNVTNEDLKIAAITYLERVEKYVKQAMKKKDNMERWGGEAACVEFLKLKNDIVNFRPSEQQNDDNPQDDENAMRD